MHPKMVFNTELEGWFLELFDQYLLARKSFMSGNSSWITEIRELKYTPRPTNADIGNLEVLKFWEDIFNKLSPRDLSILLSLYDNSYTPVVALQKTMLEFGFHRIAELEKYVENIFLQVYVIFQKKRGGKIYE